mmetsp:Transcript_61700/g.127448  ORF Transcript_61700/g.127448 Transcript_61700/m.127448 type:complete len:84 (-) Transcript_61700:45-296(-)
MLTQHKSNSSTQANTQTRTHMCKTHAREYTRVNTRECKHTRANTRTRIQTCEHTHTNTYKHTIHKHVNNTTTCVMMVTQHERR